jgi:lipoprotein-anchoring transpeptidase ErfK/SrfK
MKPSYSSLGMLVLALAVVLGAGLAGYAVVQARAQGGESRQYLAPVQPPKSSSAPQATYKRWSVGKAIGPVTVFSRPDENAPVKAKLGKTTESGYPTLVLVDTVRTVEEVTWYRVWLAVLPNGSRGWVREGQLGFFTTSSKIVIDLSERSLTVYRRGRDIDTFAVAVGRPGLETPTGFYFINQKLRPPSPGGPYGVLALGISAFQPKLPDWPQGGPVAIHGTNEDRLIGKAVSHGCVRMHDKDVLEVSRLVPAGSPVVIER